MSDVEDLEELERQVRALDRRVRRRKLAVERLNPLEAPEAYAVGFEELVSLEAELRALRVRAADPEPDPDRGPGPGLHPPPGPERGVDPGPRSDRD